MSTFPISLPQELTTIDRLHPSQTILLEGMIVTISKIQYLKRKYHLEVYPPDNPDITMTKSFPGHYMVFVFSIIGVPRATHGSVNPRTRTT